MTTDRIEEQRVALLQELREYNEANSEGWTSDNQEHFDKLNSKLDGLDETSRRDVEIADREKKVLERELEKMEAEKARQDRGRTFAATAEDRAPKEDDFNAALHAWALRAQRPDAELTQDQMDACHRSGVNPSSGHIDIRLDSSYRSVLAEQRAMTVTTSGGGHLIPEGFVANWERALLQFSDLRNYATVIRTDSGNDLPQPMCDDTGNKGELLAINAAAGSQDIATGVLSLGAYKYSSKTVLVPTELIEDSAFNLDVEIGAMLGERIARITNEHFTTGTGVSQPQGVVVGAASSTTEPAAVAAITWAELTQFMHEVDPAYRGAGAAWMMNDDTLRQVRLLQDPADQYIFTQGAAGAPNTIMGFPVIVNSEVATVAASAKAWVFGDMTKFIIRDVSTVRLSRLVERYGEFDQVGFVAFSRHDSAVLNAGTNPIKMMDHPAS